MMKQFIQWMVMMVAVLSLSSYGTTVMSDDTFGYSSGGDGPFASVHSWVVYDDVDTYTYYYHVLDVTEDYRINYFQFDIPETSAIGFSKGQTNQYDGGAITGDLYAGWYTLETGGIVYGMGAIFTTPISYGLSSYILWFESDLEPLASSGMLSGFDPGYESIALSGTVYTPVPEPATLLLLAAGAGFVIRMKRKEI